MITSAFKNTFNTASGFFTPLAVIVFFSTTFTACINNTKKEIQDVEDLQQMASLGVKDLHTIVTDSGFYKYEFETPDVKQYDNIEEPFADFPQGLKFKMFGAHGQTTKTRIRCNNAKFYKDRNLWELNNDVEAVTEKGDILSTEQLFWDAKEHTIYSEKFVKITTKNQVITGYGFESDEKLSKYEIKHPGGEIEVDNN